MLAPNPPHLHQVGGTSFFETRNESTVLSPRSFSFKNLCARKLDNIERLRSTNKQIREKKMYCDIHGMDATVNFVLPTVLASTFWENECTCVPTLLWKAKLYQVYWLSWYFPNSVDKK